MAWDRMDFGILHASPVYIDGIQRPLRDEFVREGLMLGEFHQLSQSKGIHNKEFRPLRSPIPMLTIRHMVSTED
jgi:hypothetical protein